MLGPGGLNWPAGHPTHAPPAEPIDDGRDGVDGIDGVDKDGDGLASVESGGTDCNDEDVDEDASTGSEFFTDADGDGYGDANASVILCELQDGYADNADDCDDTSALANPDGEEVCDGLDNDCNGLTDDDDSAVSDQSEYYIDVDGDGYGDLSTSMLSCESPDGYIDNSEDCNDTDASVNPMMEEIPVEIQKATFS